MRAPSQLKLESAPAYAIGYRFKIGEREYLPGEFVDGDVARAWPTFRQILGLDWLIPATAVPTATAATTAPARVALRKGR